MSGFLSIGDFLRGAAAEEPDAVAFIEGGRRFTYAEWDRAADAAAAAYARAGLEPGEVVALLLPAGIDYPVAYLGAARAGLVTAGINPRYGEREVAAILANSGAAAALTVEGIDGRPARRLVERLRAETLRCVLEPSDLEAGPGAPAVSGTTTGSGTAADAAPAAAPDPRDPVAIVYTSGTSGLPKGATYTHGALEVIRRIETTLDPRPGGRTLGAIPLAHMAFMTKIGAAIARRRCTVFMGPWNARAALEAIEAHRITELGGIPTQLALMLMDPRAARVDRSSVRLVILGGAPATPDLVRGIRGFFDAPVVVRYSSTEMGLATGTRPGDPDEVVAETVGRPLPEVDLEIRGAEGERLGAGKVGEVHVRHTGMMAGYWRDPDATRAVFDPAGFYRTGDLGSLDPDGNLRLAGRTSEMYIRGGYNIYPAEVESVLREHPKVGLAAVIGIPDPVLGERGLAYVTPRDPGDPPDPGDLRGFVAERIADYKAPDVVEVRPELPLTPMFKIDKAALAGEG